MPTNLETDLDDVNLLEATQQELEKFQLAVSKVRDGVSAKSVLQDYVQDVLAAITTNLLEWADDVEERMEFLLENQQRQGVVLLSILGAADANALGTALAAGVMGGADSTILRGLAEQYQQKAVQANAVIASALTLTDPDEETPEDEPEVLSEVKTNENSVGATA